MTDSLTAALESLHLALTREHEALLAGDPVALHAATSEKLVALQQVEAEQQIANATPLAEATREFIAQIAKRNRVNGALITANRRSAQRALVNIGRATVDTAYDDSGRQRTRPQHRPLGAA